MLLLSSFHNNKSQNAMGACTSSSNPREGKQTSGASTEVPSLRVTKTMLKGKPPISLKISERAQMSRALRVKEENSKHSLALKKATAEAALGNNNISQLISEFGNATNPAV